MQKRWSPFEPFLRKLGDFSNTKLVALATSVNLLQIRTGPNIVNCVKFEWEYPHFVCQYEHIWARLSRASFELFVINRSQEFCQLLFLAAVKMHRQMSFTLKWHYSDCRIVELENELRKLRTDADSKIRHFEDESNAVKKKLLVEIESLTVRLQVKQLVRATTLNFV